MTTGQMLACAISWTAAIAALTALVHVRRAHREPIQWEIKDGLLTFDRHVTEEEMRQFRAKWLERYGKTDKTCSAYLPPATPAESGLCARCGMYDYKHQEQPGT